MRADKKDFNNMESASIIYMASENAVQVSLEAI